MEVVFLKFPVFKVFLESPVTSISQRCLSFAFRFGDWPLPVSPPNPSTVLESSFPLQSIDYYKAVLAAAGSPSCYSSTRRNVVLPPITRFTPLVRDLVEQTEQSCCWLLDDITHSLVCRETIQKKKVKREREKKTKRKFLNLVLPKEPDLVDFPTYLFHFLPAACWCGGLNETKNAACERKIASHKT